MDYATRIRTQNTLPRKWTDEQLIEAVAHARSMNECGPLLGLKSQSAAYRTLPRHIARLRLSTAHWLGRQNSGNVNGSRVWTLEEILVVDSPYTSTNNLKKRLLKAGLLDEVCSVCRLGPSWNGKRLVLQLDHVNGIRKDCRRENLRLLCPNCHSQTTTFSGKNAKHG